MSGEAVSNRLVPVPGPSTHERGRCRTTAFGLRVDCLFLVVSSCCVFPENLFENPVGLDQDKLGEVKNMEAMAILGNRRGRGFVLPLRKAERRAYRKQPARGVLWATTQCMFCSNRHANAVHVSEPHHLVAAKVSAPWMPCEGGSNSFAEDKMPHTAAQYG